MSMRTGDAYKAALQDGREVWLDGERVADVVTDPRLERTVDSIAALYDHQADCANAALLVSETRDGRQAATTFIEPAGMDDLVRRREASCESLALSGGTMGRGPDFMNVHMTALASAADHFAQAGAEYGERIRDYYKLMSSEGLCLTHVLANPQTDRSREVHEVEQDTAARIVEERADGVVIRGARMIGTLAPFADEVAVFPSTYLPMSPEAMPYAYAFVIPVATAGLRLICRPALAPPPALEEDFPLSSRFDEMDAVAIFDDVVVPWARLFVYQRPDVANGAFTTTGAAEHLSHYGCARLLTKFELLLGTALRIADAIGIEGFEHVQAKIAELITSLEMVRACTRAAEVDCVAGPGGTVIPGREPIWVIRSLVPTLFPRMAEILQLLGASGYMSAPSAAELQGGASPDIYRYYQGATIPADQRIELFRLGWELSCSSFAGRQVLYERFGGGDPWRLALTRFRTYQGKDRARELVGQFLPRGRALDQAASTALSGESTG
jgi:4-hydroxyphenylacetate 3-monooxygenase oxygenase component